MSLGNGAHTHLDGIVGNVFVERDFVVVGFKLCAGVVLVG